MTDRELLQQALDALCVSSKPKSGHRRNELHLTPKLHIELYMEAIEAIRTRLAQPEMINGLTEEKTNETMSVKGLTQPEPEPVAWFMEGTFIDGTPSFIQVCETDPEFYTPLYTSPPKKEWVGLTGEEIQHLSQFNCGTRGEFARAIEAVLKEKNT